MLAEEELPSICAFQKAPPSPAAELRLKASRLPATFAVFSFPLSNPPPPQNPIRASNMSQTRTLTPSLSDDDDDFQCPVPSLLLTQTTVVPCFRKSASACSSQPLKASNKVRSSKKPKLIPATGKENFATHSTQQPECTVQRGRIAKKTIVSKGEHLLNPIEETLPDSSSTARNDDPDEDSDVDFEPGTQLKDLMRLCSEIGEIGDMNDADTRERDDLGGEDIAKSNLVVCPLCGIDITKMSEGLRQAHTNECLDKEGESKVDMNQSSARQGVDVCPVVDWLQNLGLSKYEQAFLREEIDWDSLQWLTEEDLVSIGVTALGPRKKILHALNELRNRNTNPSSVATDLTRVASAESKKTVVYGNKLITEFFKGSSVVNRRNKPVPLPIPCQRSERRISDFHSMKAASKKCIKGGRFKDVPSWCCIPGTPFRVDAFRYLRGDCTYWFLTHFHIDHYQGLTRGFSHGLIYCSSVTAHLVNTKIGVPWDKLQILPLNQKIRIAGVNVTCLDANHCPGSIIILFEPPNKKAVLHTGDFRFGEEMASNPVLQACHIHTLILDTTYCNPLYDFPKQDAVIQFVIEAIQAEAFNPKTLFLIGSYTIGKERLFLEVARFLRKKIYVGAAKLRLLECMELPEEDMQWFTLNEQESHIHVVPLWTIASFKRMKHFSSQYAGRYDVIVAFSPTGWTYGKGKKKAPGRRCQQGTIIRYEVPYSEHCSYTELKEFVRHLSPDFIIPSVNNDGPESADTMINLLTSDS